MEQSPAAAPHLPRRRLTSWLALDVRALARTRVEDLALAGGYFGLFWLLEAVNFTAFGSLKVQWLASAWPALAVLGCCGVLFRRTAAPAMAWMCGIAAMGLLLAGHAGAFILIFELFFSVVLFATPRASLRASRTAWVLSALLLLTVYGSSRDAGLTVAAGFVAVLTLLTPVEWAGNLRKATVLAQSESARADAVHEAAAQRLLAERNAHDLALEQARQHMARELHDVISARLSAIALQSGAALHAARSGPESALLRQIRKESVAGLDELNTMIRLLHSGGSSQAPGQISELRALIEGHRAAGRRVDFSIELPDGGQHLPPAVQTTVYRIAAEALANAAKHAPGTAVHLSLSSASVPAADTPAPEMPAPDTPPAGHELLLRVGNALPLQPAGPSSGTGTGLPSMHFRAAHAGGSLSAGPVANAWQVLLRLPLAGPANPASLKTTHEGNLA